MEEKIEKIIYDWVGRNFGSQEAEDPSWNIEELAKEITNKLEKGENNEIIL